MEMRRVKVKALDIIICVLVICAAVMTWLLPSLTSSTGSGEVLVICGDAQTHISLEDGEHAFSGNGYSLTVRVRDGAVSVIDSTCPDGICEHRGEIRASGEIIVCASAHISVRIVNGGEYDAVVH